MPTYRQIADCVRRRTGRTVRTCWIAESQARVRHDDTGGMESRTG